MIVLSHDEQLDRLRRACPEAATAAVVVGDPCFDQMAASRPLRESYRQAFGVAEHQRLVVVTSTWGQDSLYGSDPQLAHRLAARLPVDSYRVVVALHPNVVHGHSPWQVKLWLDACSRAGVLVLPSEDLWQSALVAADLVIGDHGSVTFYAAALGLPVLLASAPRHAVDPDSPIAELLRVAPLFAPAEDPQTQMDRVISEHDPALLRPVTQLTTSRPGESLALLRQGIYRLLDLDPPPQRAPTTTAPLPDVELPRPRALMVTAELTGPDDGLIVTITRHSAESLCAPRLLPDDAHLVVCTDEPDVDLLDRADVLVHHRPVDPEPWLTATLRALPGCLIAAAPVGQDSWLVGTRDGALIRVCASKEPAVFASVIHAWLTAGKPIGQLPGTVTVWLGPLRIRSTTAVLRLPSGQFGQPRLDHRGLGHQSAHSVDVEGVSQM